MTATQKRIRRIIDAGLTIIVADVNDGYTPLRPQASVVPEVVDTIAAEIDALKMKADSFDDFAKWLGDPRDDRHPGEIMADYQQKQREAAK